MNKRKVTPQRLAANQAAAQQSSGPKTAEGKKRSAANSLQHGGYATDPAIRAGALGQRGASERYDALCASLDDDWKPSTPQQRQLVEDLAWLTLLRDEAREAFLDGHERRLRRHTLGRDHARFHARERAAVAADNECLATGLVCMATSEDQLERLARIIPDLILCARKAAWIEAPEGAYNSPGYMLRLLYGDEPQTARGRKLVRLWNCAKSDKRAARSEEAREILALLGEEQQALEGERDVFERERALEEELADQPPGLFPLDETGAELLFQIERLERQINAKIRLLLRLERREREFAPPAKNESGWRRHRGVMSAMQHPMPTGAGAPLAAPDSVVPAPFSVVPAKAGTQLLENDATVAQTSAFDVCESSHTIVVPGEIDETNPKEPLESMSMPSPEELRRRVKEAYGIDMAVLAGRDGEENS